MTAVPVHSKERLAFPFDQTTRITFIRLGDIKADSGQQFVLTLQEGQWSIERRISRYSATYEDISADRAYEILTAFSELYAHWQDSPYRDSEKLGYSLFISINDTWQTALRVKDRGSPELRRVISIIEYPDGVVLNPLRPSNAPGIIRASSAEDPDSTNTTAGAAGGGDLDMEP
jgi:hypothetical protein